ARRDVEGHARAGGEPAGRGGQRVAHAALVDRQPREGGHAARGRHGGGARQRAAAWVSTETDGDGAREGGIGVAQTVLRGHLHRGGDGRPGGRVRRLYRER